MQICISKLTIIGSDNGLSPAQRQAIIWTIDGILLIWPLRTKFIEVLIKIHIFIAATKQLYEWFSPSVRLSVCPSVTPFWLCSYHRIIMKFSGVITSDKSNVHAKGQGQRWKVKGTEVTTQLNRFRTVTPVWIHTWWWNHAYGLMILGRGALLFFKVIRQISRSHGSKKRRIWPRLGVSGLYLQFDFTNGYKMMHKARSGIEEVPYCFSRSSVKFQGHTALKSVKFDPDWAFPDCNSSLNSPMAMKWYTKLEAALKRCPVVFQGHPSNFKVTRL